MTDPGTRCSRRGYGFWEHSHLGLYPLGSCANCDPRNPRSSVRTLYLCLMQGHLHSGGIILTFVTVVMLILNACVREETFYDGGDLRLSFSVDTLRFDTVFTTQGSATRSIKVFNPRKEPIRIREIRFRDNQAGFFRMNVDGVSGQSFRDVEILGRDSIYLFVEVTIDPDQPLSVSPFVVEEAIRFETGGGIQDLPVEAWGQNAIYIPDNTNSKGVARLTCAMGEVLWNDPRPYVIFGVLLIDSCTLRILEGSRVHLHGGVVNSGTGFYTDGLIYTQPHGVLRIEGKPGNPVIIRSDRLEPGFARLPGQWNGIRLGPDSRGHVFEHVRIYNPVVGVLVDSNATLDIRDAEIAYTGSSGLVSFAGDIRADNVLLHSNGRNGIQLSLGGRHRFRHCTVANFGNTADALFASNLYCLDPLCSDFYLLPMEMSFQNCILVGNQRDEIAMVDGSGGAPGFFQFDFSHSLVRIEELLDPKQWPTFLEDCDQCLAFRVGDRLFRNQAEFDFRPDSLAVFRRKGFYIPDLPFDLDGVARDMVSPDPGCYEYQP
jgi:hypothetical protein